MARFVMTNRETAYLLPPSVDDWLPQGHLARLIVEVVDQLDLSEIAKKYAGRGSDAYHPSTLIALLIYGYATGVYSSRKIERATYESIAFRYVAGNVHPDHATLAGFRKSYLKEFEAIFVQVLQVAKEMKLLKLGNVSLDGTKIKANASKHKALSYGHINKIEAQLREEVAALLKRAEQIDNQPADGMDLPAELERREARLQQLADAKARIEERARIRDAEELAEYEAKCAKREALRKEGKKPKGKDPEPPTTGPRDKDQVNLTDEESRIMKASGGGFVQGYNAQAAVDLDTMLIVSAKVTQDCNDKKQIEPMLAEIKDLPDDLGKVTGLLADTGYFSEKNVNHCDNLGVTPMIAMKRDHHNMPLAERFAEDAACPDATDSVSQMAWRLKTKAGRALYAFRKSTVEPVFGIVKNVMGFRQFSMRGLNEANGEWNLVAIAWNLKRMNILKMV
ncbi:MAG: IS1182 family transposase [Gammaproteobacteria bacterium]|nr:IS1182 family transposase [Gammaproteobacteria bacterium]